MDSETCRRLFSDRQVARLATISPGDRPHLVPVVFVAHGDSIVTVIDHKPKRSNRLQRVVNVVANPAVSVLADHYESDWSRLWWVRADGHASILESGRAHSDAIDLLAVKYPYYRARRPNGPVITISVDRWSGWSAAVT